MTTYIDRIYFISRHGYDYYHRVFLKGEQGKCSISRLGIHNDFNVAIYRCNHTDKNIFKIISCSYVHKLKRIELIINAIAEIEEIAVHWVHIGDGSDYDTIVSLARERLDKKTNISYEFKGFISNNHIMLYYHDNYFDVFISLSESEGLPVSMMEAISFGIPIIATNVGGVAELVNKETGILLDPQVSCTEVKKAIVDFFHLPNQHKESMRKAARLLWEKEFNASLNYMKFSKELVSFCN
ncbi:MAG: glycosyltransferase [Bacteroidales bacterium]|nr:glycosyltransferase [Bacteroidales bacterium]